MRVHLVLYSNGEPFNTVKRMLIESIEKNTKHEVIIHDYTLEKIKQTVWFKYIKELPSIPKHTSNPIHGGRDGYYNCWKSFITKDVYDQLKDDDILYYVDSCRHYRSGFTENIDKLCDIVKQKGGILGSVGDDFTNLTDGCCDNIKLWDKIMPDKDNNKHLNMKTVLNSWFILKKTVINSEFISEWVNWSVYKDNDLPYPLVTYHHTADQSIFNILVHKYNLQVFYSINVGHDKNKDRNVALNIINNACDTNQYFICL
jgi:hypothetical protein